MKIETWASIRHLYHVEKLPKKVIARELGIDPKTVRRALKQETFSRAPSRPRASKLDAFKDKIGELLTHYARISAVRIYEEIRTLGYSGGISILRDYLRPLRSCPKTFLHIQTTPGEQAQCDWAYAGKIASQRVYGFVMVLSFSRMLYLEFFSSQTIEHFYDWPSESFPFL